ncbi:hypothetical protein [Lysobacter hankyongensis]|uniref:hypothetical protein n=1 Tax=Lysobacter hankyongensis TaxID=1176535 RepID=UPI0031EF5F87
MAAVEAGFRLLRAADRIAADARRFGAAVEMESGVHRENPAESRDGRAARAAIGAHITPGIFGLQTFFSQFGGGMPKSFREQARYGSATHRRRAKKNRATGVALQSTTHRGEAYRGSVSQKRIGKTVRGTGSRSGFEKKV